MIQHSLPPNGRSSRPGPNVDQARRVLERFGVAASPRGRRTQRDRRGPASTRSWDWAAVENVKDQTVRRALITQSVYYVVTGLAPFVSRRAFEAVTGPKREWWLVQTVGALL